MRRKSLRNASEDSKPIENRVYHLNRGPIAAAERVQIQNR